MDQQVAVRQTYFQRMLFDRCLDEEFVRRFWATPDLIVDQGLPLKLSDASTVTRISLCDMSGSAADGGEVHALDAVAKRFNPRGLVHSIRHMLMASRASRNWTYGRMLVAAGVATPRPFAMLEKPLGALPAALVCRDGACRGHFVRCVPESGSPASRCVGKHCPAGCGLVVEIGRVTNHARRSQAGESDRDT